MLKPIIAYLPKIAVEGGLVIKTSLPDWCPDEEVLGSLARRLGVRTVGEIVEALRAPAKSARGVAAGEVEVSRAVPPIGCRVWGLGERVG